MSDQIWFEARAVNVRAYNSTHVPMLDVLVEIEAHSWGGGESVRTVYEKGDEVALTPLFIDAFLGWNPAPDAAGENWPQYVARGFARSTRTNPLRVDAEPPTQIELMFPIPLATLSQMEETREEKPRIGVWVRLAGVVQRKPAGQSSAHPVEPFQITIPIWRSDARGQPLEIERSKWVDEVLPGLGVGSWTVFEIPTAAFDGSAQVDEYVRNAVTQFHHHEWKLCVAACRDVVEALEPELRAQVNTAFGGRGGSASKKARALSVSYADLMEAMQTFQAASKSLLAAGAHPERPDQLIERPDAEFALWIAIALRRYVGMRLRGSAEVAPAPATDNESPGEGR